MNILFIGDVMGKAGRWVLSQLLRAVKEKHKIDFTVANVENAAGGFGLTEPISQKIMSYGVDVQTSGNHIWDRSDIFPFLDEAENRILRPANYPAGSPGFGSYVYHMPGSGKKVGIINIEGRVYGRNIDCPFRTVDGELSLIRSETKVIIVDFHAETTSEKEAMAHYLDGRVSLLAGTHTHVQTADERVLPKGTAYITDVGMTGPHSGVIGMKVQPVLARFLTGFPHRFAVATDNVKMAGVVVQVDDQTGTASSIERLMIEFDGKMPDEYVNEKSVGMDDGEDS